MIVAGHGTSLPLATNRIDLDPELKDAWGLPALRMTYKDHPDDLAMARYLQDRGVESMQAAGALEVWKEPVTESTAGPHLLGTARMGNDPGRSVLNRNCQAHDVKNLFVADGGPFVSQADKNPTWTILALSMRTSAYISGAMKRGEL